VHSAVVEQANRDLRLKAHATSSILKRLCAKENIQLLFESGEFLYFDDSYKGPQGEKEPPGHYLEVAADPEEYQKYIRSNSPIGNERRL